MATIQSETDCYDIIEVLGKGTFGEVAKGWRRSTGEMVAIKILKNDAYRNRIIKNELKLLRCMRGLDPDEAHVIRFLEFFHDALKFYLVFELLEQNLFEFQKENNFAPLPARHIRTVTLQVLRALARLKELAIIHADLKPENIMLVDQTRCPFRVKVIDFGSASIFSEVRYVKEPYIQSRFYRAPEILLGLPFCEKVDVWSLGCVMAELHLGWPLYPGNNEYDQVRYICETQGLPKPHLLHNARKTHNFFKRNPHPDATNPWQLKSSADYLAETKVIDFGSASIFSEVRYVKEPYIQSRFYRAPEILLGLPFCEKVDVWSLGCVMAELHLGWPLYPGNNEYDQVRYICETQGLPKPHLLHNARKTHNFFKRNPHPDATNPWQLKSSADYLAETKVRPLERRKYMLKSLDQIETVNGGVAASRLTFPDREALAEHADLKSMVELIKRMLTWESHERISPSAALRHPFVSMQQLRSTHETTRYYQLSLRSCRLSLQARKPPVGSKSDSNFSNLIRLSQASPEDDGPCRGSGWEEGERAGASAEPPAILQRDGDGPSIKDMTMDAGRAGSELFDPSSCPGEWLNEPDWTLEGVRGARAQGLPPRHSHPHKPPRATSFLQHVGGHH
ncbi:Homeodomain-interacting protein kinase 4 [Tupaia chinensis]|uniref:Homeodomain-interacting protein kinase 4 n=1 Tax=Tupaia chinensis TaxID=246437 RepID=L9LB95_TUPCH|nr:Homeodomain-interacting protein kinase 4 [Tupaia chinensis]